MAAAPIETAVTRTAQDVVTYEQPLNERVRTFLRLEFLFAEVRHHMGNASPWASRAAIRALIDIVGILGRSDVRSDLIQDLERQSTRLARFRESPDVDSRRLTSLLASLSTLRGQIATQAGQVTHALKENEFLRTIRHRSTIPGGTCQFDLPDYGHWLSQSYSARLDDLQAWLDSLQPMRDAVTQLLWLLRESGQPEVVVARGGLHLHSVDRDTGAQLIRVGLPGNSLCFPEISCGAHRVSVRFLGWNSVDGRPKATSEDVTFTLSCC